MMLFVDANQKVKQKKECYINILKMCENFLFNVEGRQKN
jgi:hypothetical protein